mmetsp:Transcript_4710/g.6726  ORF Transcript_4710/g.6726 Transcript_4710/m.6726 type:complete len:538 (-) Transcript_4710:35-1648(-)
MFTPNSNISEDDLNSIRYSNLTPIHARSPSSRISYRLSNVDADPRSKLLLSHKNSAKQSILDISEVDGSTHSYAEDEVEFYVNYINQVLASNDAISHRIPLFPTSFFDCLNDGIILCHLVNYIEPGSISEKMINGNENVINKFQKMENCSLTLSACKAAGANIINISGSDIYNKNPILVLGLLWQLVRTKIVARISMNVCPQLVFLKEPDEDGEAFESLSVEKLLMRWFNHQLFWAGSDRRITNFDKDLQDGICISQVVTRLSNGQAGSKILAKFKDESPEQRIAQVMNVVISDLDVKPLIQPHHIINGRAKQNMAFVAQLFDASPNLVDMDTANKSVAVLQAHFRGKKVRRSNILPSKRAVNRKFSAGTLKEIMKWKMRESKEILNNKHMHEEYETIERDNCESPKYISAKRGGKMFRGFPTFGVEWLSRSSKKSNDDRRTIDNKNGFQIFDKNGTISGKLGDGSKGHKLLGGQMFMPKYTLNHPLVRKIEEWADRNPGIVKAAEYATKTAAVASVFTASQAVFMVSSEMSVAGIM